jgi:hypothetical protein
MARLRPGLHSFIQIKLNFMGRSVDYLSNAERVNYFQWPTLWVYDEDTDQDVETDELWDAADIIADIRETITSNYPGFDPCSRWDGRETHIILEGYGVEIGLSEYCGLATLSVRVNESILNYFDTDEEAYQVATNWIHENWDQASEHWNQYRKIGTFSNGESVYETK